MFKFRMLFFVTALRNVIFKHKFKLVQTQQHVDRRAAKRTAASLVVHFVGTRLTEAASARCVYHAVPRDTPRRSQQLRQLIRWASVSSSSSASDTLNGSHLASSLNRRHSKLHHESLYTALMCLPVCCSVATLTG